MHASSPPAWLRSLCQRVPFASHLVVLLIAINGPKHAPWLYISTLTAAHLLLFAMCCFSLIGSYCAWRGAKAHYAVDWHATVMAEPAVHLSEKEVEGDLEADGQLRASDVHHLILVPNYKEDISTLRDARPLRRHPL
jgi:hypothetical protein